MPESADFFAVASAAAAVLVAWFGVPKALYDLLSLWRDRNHRRARRAIDFAKEFPEEPRFRGHARRLVSAAMVDVRGLKHEQRMALLELEDESVHIRNLREFQRWLTINVIAGQVRWAWHRAELADPRYRRAEQWKLFAAYLGYLAVAFLPFVVWRVVVGRDQPPWSVLVLMLLFMVFFMGIAMLQTSNASTLRRAARLVDDGRSNS
jgi:hypothetical protein